MGADAVVIPALDSIAWLLNVRGTDVSRTPVALSSRSSMPTAPPSCSSRPARSAMPSSSNLGNAVRVRDRADFAAALGAFAGKRVAVDPTLAVAAIFDRIEGGAGRRSPCATRPWWRRRGRTPPRSPAIVPLRCVTAPRSRAS
ncbi:aminopeptidase P family N-terminal domain-containing protein [Sphingomonas sp. MMS24-JH45]